MSWCRAGWARLGPAADNQRLWRLTALLPLVGLALLVNPYGLGVGQYFLDYGRDPSMFRMISEWRAPSAAEHGGALFLGLIFGSLLLCALAPRRLDLKEGLLLAAFGATALASSRGIIGFGIVAAPIVAAGCKGLVELRREPGPGQRGVRFLELQHRRAAGRARPAGAALVAAERCRCRPRTRG